jgi:hypothetical protein
MKKTQGALLVGHIRVFPEFHGRTPTYLDLLLLGISTCPHKRLTEPSALAALKPGERLLRGKNAQGLVTFQITGRKA